MAIPDTSIDPRILESAKIEFLQHGYQKASLQQICKNANVTTGALYKRYSGKEELFGTLVEPALQEIFTLYERTNQRDYSLLDDGQLYTIWQTSEETLRMWMDCLYENYDGMKLLLCCSEGTKHSGFLHNLIKLYMQQVLDFANELKRRDITVKSFSEPELYILLTSYLSAISGVIVQNFTIDEAYSYCKTLARFFNWQIFFGF